ncbi:1-acyl-sn-glycerol-3-phosphate acyltransferase [Aeromicrobium fastidiosum]|uniref:Acyl-phosphate glycerol 3-phosphate acyltransferase n=1 Tax=Aeromicrobium fastidiosum TaxID=52699 RepID=A0A641APT2_9ACTN|nr:1-acyl-sn-glycerol-3-phosphate acyltransferase [Aeromicrobium fastidiosum]KAA1378102.1 acyl-phosphate glycerol 3-phosphate acyltransferase [Aeromicrobium fastidiosum]MBP2389102.1 1-acyl-sn-glycerol-3-phosphate acyltransferase [Aeromicrobium fastidiosum]
MIRQRLARTIARLMRYRMVGDVPQTGILVGAPHTSNWDFITMLLVMWQGGAHPRVLVKKQLFKGPVGWLLRALGGVPLDRDNAGTVVRDLVDEAGAGNAFRLILAAEGTRSRGEYWKSGFLRLSRETGLPITLAFFDPPTRTMGFGPTFHATDDVTADMDIVRAFYADKHGIKPKNATPPRLREEG